MPWFTPVAPAAVSSLTRGRPTMRLVVAMLVGALLTPLAPVSGQDEVVVSQPFEIELELVANGFTRPVFLADPDDGSGRLFVVEQGGRIWILSGESGVSPPFLDLSDQVATSSEQGLLSMAFHPDFANNGLFFIYYTDLEGHTQVERFAISPDDPDQADLESRTTILTVEQPYSNHNGGLLLFGPDGYLYIGLGDGGSFGDPLDNGQDRTDLLGSILRIDIDSGDPYAIPEDNPFANGEEGAPEVWNYGLRNPWRFSFDRETGDLYIADVGERDFEEVNVEPAGSGGGLNYGWNLAEGDDCFAAPDCEEHDLVWPVFTYSHEFGCSVTGGYVVRDPELQALNGVYLFADYCSGFLWGLMPDGDGGWIIAGPIETELSVSSFAEDATGRVYLIDLEGGIYRLAG